MSDTIYWAVKLDWESKDKLLASFPPIHKNVYAEHTTIVFSPNSFIDSEFNKRLGEKVELVVIGKAEDDKGQAVLITSDCVSRTDNGIMHITISCVDGIMPAYSNGLVRKDGWFKTDYLTLFGNIAKFTKYGWEYK